MTARGLVVRQATAGDAALLATLGATLFADAFGAANTPENLAVYLAASFNPAKQRAELADPAVTYLIAEAGAPVGYAQLRAGAAPPAVSGSQPIELVRLYAGRAGHGVGSMLMRSCIDRAASAGHDVLWLGVWEYNARAQEFYRRWGFQTVGTHGFQLGDDLQTDLLMQRAIPARASEVSLKTGGNAAWNADGRS